MAALNVVAVRCFIATSHLKRPFVTARRRTESVDAVVAEVELAGGEIGQGSAAETLAVTGEDAATMTAAITGPLSAVLLTAPAAGPAALAEAIGAACPGATSAKAAVEVALHDAWARSLGLPLVEALGGALPADLATDMTVSLRDPETMAADARAAAADGYTLLKIKLGGHTEEDLDRLHAVAAAAPGTRLRIDANQGWSADEAIEVITRFEAERLPVDLVEQPVAAADLDGLAHVSARVATPIMADEAVSTPAQALEFAARHAADLLNVKLAKCGGLRAAWRIADIAAAAGIPVMVGSMMEPRISVTAALHLAAAHPDITMIDLDSPQWFHDDVPAGGYDVDRGRLRLRGGPGLGLHRLPPPSQEG